MPVTTENQLSAQSRALYLKARHASEIGNHGYVIQLMQPVLKESPGFLDGRKLSRAAALQLNKGKKSGFSLAGTTIGITAGGTLKKDPLAAMELAEKTLATDPTNPQANQLLFEAASKAGLPETAAFALETLVGSNPKDTKLLHQLGDYYVTIGEGDKAVAIFNRISQVNPADLEAIKKGKDASASQTMKKGKWEEVSQSGGSMSFRDLIKNKDEATALENKNKVVRTADQIAQQVTELYAQWEANQNAVDITRRIANLYEQWFDVASATTPEECEQYLDSAIWFYSHANTLLNGGDPNISRKYTDLQLKKTERRIQVLEAWLAQVDPHHPEAQPYVDELRELKAQRDQSILETARKRVADNPTDLQLRYELGEVLIKSGNYKDAVPELQRARQNPNVRLKAMNLLGQCFVQRGMLDMAETQFKTAASEILAMDATKKDVLYQLAMVYEKLGKKDDYIACLKQIYEADYGYLDVAQRVESSYGG